MRILLICAAGMSTSLMVTRMQAAAKERGLEATIWAVSADRAEQEASKADVILLGPQIKFLRGDIERVAKGVPLEVIPMTDYGLMNGDKILTLAYDLIQQQ